MRKILKMIPYRREGFHSITPYIIVPNVRSLIEFLESAFGANLDNIKERSDESVMHAEMQIGDSKIMMGEPTETFGSMPGCIYLYVPDCNATYIKAIESGGKSIMKPANMPSGERYGGIEDLCGNQWWIATHLGELSDTVEEKRFKEYFDKQDG